MELVFYDTGHAINIHAKVVITTKTSFVIINAFTEHFNPTVMPCFYRGILPGSLCYVKSKLKSMLVGNFTESHLQSKERMTQGEENSDSDYN